MHVIGFLYVIRYSANIKLKLRNTQIAVQPYESKSQSNDDPIDRIEVFSTSPRPDSLFSQIQPIKYAARHLAIICVRACIKNAKISCNGGRGRGKDIIIVESSKVIDKWKTHWRRQLQNQKSSKGVVELAALKFAFDLLRRTCSCRELSCAYSILINVVYLATDLFSVSHLLGLVHMEKSSHRTGTQFITCNMRVHVRHTPRASWR